MAEEIGAEERMCSYVGLEVRNGWGGMEGVGDRAVGWGAGCASLAHVWSVQVGLSG